MIVGQQHKDENGVRSISYSETTDPDQALSLNKLSCISPSVVKHDIVNQVISNVQFRLLKACSEALHSATPLPELEEQQLKITERGKRCSADPQISRSWKIAEQLVKIIQNLS